MEIRQETRNSVLVLTPTGRIDSGTAAAFEARLSQAVAGGKAKVVIDMSELGHVGSTGLRALLLSAKKARTAGSRIVLAGLPSIVRPVFAASGFADLFAIHPDVDTAVGALDALP